MKLVHAATLLLATAKAIAQDTCSDDEALVELSLLTKSANVTLLEYSYSFTLLDTTSSNVTFECKDCNFVPQEFIGDYVDSLTSYETKACVPKDHCHRFLIGTTKERWESQRIIDDFASFTLNVDGESLLDGFNAYSFGRIDFGQCEAQCTADESEFEFFVTRNQTAYSYNNGLSWSLTGSDGAEVYADKSPENTTSFLHTIQCVPKDDCYKFEVGYPSDHDTYYSIRFDGALYADGELKAPYPDGNTFHLGDCEASEVCDEGKSLFGAQLIFKDSFSRNGTEYYAVADTEVNWLLVDEDGFQDYFYDDFDGYEFGKTYAVGRCFSSDKCSQFAINTKVIDGLDSYVVSENGNELTERIAHGDMDDAEFADAYFAGTTTTSTSSCPADVWGDEPGSTASFRVHSMIVGFIAFAMVALLA